MEAAMSLVKPPDEATAGRQHGFILHGPEKEPATHKEPVTPPEATRGWFSVTQQETTSTAPPLNAASRRQHPAANGLQAHMGPGLAGLGCPCPRHTLSITRGLSAVLLQRQACLCPSPA